MTSWVAHAALVATVMSLSAEALAHDLVGIAREPKSTGNAAVGRERGNLSTQPRGIDAAIQSILDLRLPDSRSQALHVDTWSVQAVILRSKTWDTNDTIKACFYGGSATVRTAIIAYAREWTKYGNIVLDGGLGPSLRSCVRGDGASIRIAFNVDGHWAKVGTDAAPLARSNLPTMNLEGLDTEDPDTDSFRETVLHEFGHAFGFHHEHQSPLSGCEAQLDKKKIKELTHLSDAEIVESFAQLKTSHLVPIGDGLRSGRLEDSGDRIELTEYDPTSIMHYSIDERYFIQPPGSCHVKQPTGLSGDDQKAMKAAYPYMTESELRKKHNRDVRILASFASKPGEAVKIRRLLRGD